MAPNNKLEKATYLAKGKIVGPETIEINKDGLIYTGLANGEVVSVDLAGNVKKIAIIGNLKDESICSKLTIMCYCLFINCSHFSCV